MTVTLAAFANDVFNVGAGGYGLFNTFVAVGALVGAVLSTRRRGVGLRAVVIAALSYGAATVVCAFAPGQYAFVGILTSVGFTWMLFSTAANSAVQFSSRPSIRGRMMAIYRLVMVGGNAVGGPLAGVVVDAVGPVFGMAASGVVTLLLTGIIALLLWRGELLRRVPVATSTS